MDQKHLLDNKPTNIIFSLIIYAKGLSKAAQDYAVVQKKKIPLS